LLGSGDDNSILGLLHHVKGNLLFQGRSLLVLGLGTAVHLGVTEGVGEEDVVFSAIAMVVGDILAEVAIGVFHGAESFPRVV